jgi:copper transport protein
MLNHKEIPKNNYQFIVLLSIVASILISIGLLALSISHYAYAHSLPVTETPAANSIVPKGTPLPSKLTIDFSERPSPTVSSIEVLNSKNEPVNNGDFKIIGDGGREAMTTLNTKKLTDGVYTVSWETQSLDDGHIAKGSYVFGIGNVGPGAAASIASGKTLQQASTIQSVTSPLDGLVKWPIIVAQAAVVGGIFSHLFLWQNFGSKIEERRVVRYGFGYDKSNIPWLLRANIPWLRRFLILLIASSIAILAAGSSLLFLQITELSSHNNISSYWSIFVSQISGASGIQWIARSITSIILITSGVSYYYVVKRNMWKLTTDSTANIGSHHNNPERLEAKQNVYKTNKTNLSTSLLYVALIAGSISIFSNSITSHNAGVHFLPSLSISLDWLHFMGVSIWIGGLFYISTVLLSAIRSRTVTHTIPSTTDNFTMTGSSTDNLSNTDKNRSIFVYYLALLLPRFSLLATISLGVIGVSGLYMAWIQLHSLSSLFNSSYGNILIIKLSIALPLVLLGVYHQLRLHKNAVLVASIGKAGRVGVDKSNLGEASISQTLHNNGEVNKNNNIFAKDKVKVKDIPSKFSKTIKIESLVAMGVLLAASLLTITSPPSMNMAMSSMSSSSASTMSMSGMSMTPVKNSTHIIQTKIMNVNTKIEINPFYSGFNVFKVTFTDASGKPYTKVSTTEIVFGNTAADISNVVANLQKMGPGVFSVTGAYISQPGEWDIALSAQRVQDLDLNYAFTVKVLAPSAPQSTAAASQTMNNNNSMQEPPPHFDSFAWLAIGLAAAVIFGSAFYYRRSKQELRKTVEMLKVD